MQDFSATSWWNSGWSKGRAVKKRGSVEEEKALHRKRLAAILRYIASMHQDLSSSGDYRCHCFVRLVDGDENTEEDFFQSETNTEDDNRVLFSTNDFRKLISVEAMDDKSRSNQDCKEMPPFSFYAPKSSITKNHGLAVSAATNRSSGLYGLSSVFTYNKSHRGRNGNEKGLWLRLKRLGPSSVIQQPNYEHPVLQNYLNSWLKESSRSCSIQDLLTIHNIDRAPSIPNTVSIRNHRFIKSFLRRYRIYLRTKLYQQTLEPIYNSLFEWNQQPILEHSVVVYYVGHLEH